MSKTKVEKLCKEFGLELNESKEEILVTCPDGFSFSDGLHEWVTADIGEMEMSKVDGEWKPSTKTHAWKYILSRFAENLRLPYTRKNNPDFVTKCSPDCDCQQ